MLKQIFDYGLSQRLCFDNPAEHIQFVDYAKDCNLSKKRDEERAFSEKDKQAAFSKQGGMCPICKRLFAYAEMAGDHIKPWSKGGQTVPENCQMLCKDCNGKKSDMY